MKSLLIFDLDGTLLNTIEDMAASTNYALAKCNFEKHETSKYRFYIGNGINKLFERVLPEGEKTADNIIRIREHFLDYYNQHNSELTVPYDGIIELLESLQNKGIKLAVASNKYHKATKKLVEHFFPNIQFTAVFGQLEGVAAKPDPIIVENILYIAKIPKSEVLYIGDSGVDMQTALNAQIEACGVTWGFRPIAELEEFCPKYIVNNPNDILNLLDK